MKPLLAGPASVSAEDAYAQCERLTKTHYENFTVVSWLLPRTVRKHFHAVYAYCRHVDDLGDEASGDRLVLLDEWEADLRRCYEGTPRHPFLIALQQTIRAHDIPIEPFLSLIEANRIDQGSGRFETYADLLHYCEHSATPVGRLVLYLLGHRDAKRQQLSDATCMALQLANFWQDVARDAAAGRIYIPLEDMTTFGYTEEELLHHVVNDNLRSLMAFEVDRAKTLFHEGLALVALVKGRGKLDIALFSVGGLSILKAIERQGYDVFSSRPTVSSRSKLALMAVTVAKLLARRRLV
ncbi:MAG: Phytoene/squalene synthetase [Chloroflexi bacterium]|jgi:squalene synthase HpnC|nr:MAG: Phytoene/squalene synthetase [Chloroflexota bacterium]